jgi:tRNA dimethylallyltransferase
MDLDMDRIPAAEAVLIAGPTASGKSALALALADKVRDSSREPVIVNADSMQVYGVLRILTARPDEADMARFPHLLFGHVPPKEAYSTGRWLGEAAAALDEIRQTGRFPIFAGGTGLYFKALTEGFAAIPDIPDDIRHRWRERLKTEGAGTLYGELAVRDPGGAGILEPGDAQRIVRALEVFEATGQSIVEWQRAGQADPLLPTGRAIRLAVQPDRAELYRRIEERFDRMVEAGALEEVEALAALDLDPDLPAMKAIGVKELSDFLASRVSLDEAIVQAKTRTRQYAKRQMTWMRNQMADWDWIDPGRTGADGFQVL